MNDVRLRLLALERGEDVTPPTIDEIRAALLERIGPRQAALNQVTERVSTRRRTAKDPTADLDDLLGDL